MEESNLKLIRRQDIVEIDIEKVASTFFSLNMKLLHSLHALYNNP